MQMLWSPAARARVAEFKVPSRSSRCSPAGMKLCNAWVSPRQHQLQILARGGADRSLLSSLTVWGRAALRFMEKFSVQRWLELCVNRPDLLLNEVPSFSAF